MDNMEIAALGVILSWILGIFFIYLYYKENKKEKKKAKLGLGENDE